MANNVQYGFVGLQHLWNERVTEVDQVTINRALGESLAEYNRQVNGMLSAMVDVTTERTRRVLQVDRRQLQPLDEWGNPLPTRPGGAYTVGFPIQGGGDARGTNRVSRQMMTVEELNRDVTETLLADADWMRRHMLAALLDDQSWTFDDPAGDVTVTPLANGDSTPFITIGGDGATDDHYLAGTADLSAATFTTIRRELTEHISNQGAGPVVVYVPTNLTDDVDAIPTFLEVGDPDIVLGADSDRLAANIDRGFGDEVLGKVSRVWIVEWSALPDNYMLARMVNRTPLAMRQYPSAALQGLFRENHSPNGNLLEERWIRYAGFGVQDRTSAVVYQYGSETYSTPAAFDAPLSV